MAFPTTGLIDDFNRADGGLGANWSAIGGIATELRIATNRVDSASGSATGADYYNVETFGPDCEAYVTVISLAADGETIQLYLRMANPGSSTTRDGYRLRFTFKTTLPDEWQFERVDDNVVTAIGTLTTQDIAAGDKIGFEIIGSTLKAYRHNGTSWAQVMSTTDATYSAAGYMGLVVAKQSYKVDDFSGGTVVAGGPFYEGTLGDLGIEFGMGALSGSYYVSLPFEPRGGFYNPLVPDFLTSGALAPKELV